jgi:ATP-dependent Clp protease ATP-binding subunit ClpC
MYERFTDRARKVMQLANQEAQRFNHEYIGTEHILLGLVKEGSGVAANVLKNLDIDPEGVQREVTKLVQPGSSAKTGKLPQTPRAKTVIEHSIEEARNPNHNYVGTEHLLLGLLREQEGVAAQVLMNLGLKLEDVRQAVLNMLGCVPKERDSVSVKRKPRTPFPAPPDAAQIVQELDAHTERTQREMESAITAHQFEQAALLLDRITKLTRLREHIVSSWWPDLPLPSP